jgi:cysteinyl-tRNA synthetase
MLKLYNTITRKKEAFKPIKNKRVGLYTCGLTVYNFAHIGNLRTYIFEDILKRVLEYNNFKVKHVMNITDVGHLTSDADTGEDKMAKALKREGKELNKKSMLEIANFYTKAFKKDLKNLNIKEPNIWCKATETIQDQINLVKKIFDADFAYETDKAVYFDTSKLKEYGKLAKLDLEGLKEGARTAKRKDKKNPTDFALWLKLVGEHKNHIMNWSSPWGKGFPGWHVECSAMSMKYLGERFDIHTGGIDHIPVHHTNERAQNIAATGHPVVNFWMHGEFLVLAKEKMAKSKGGFITLKDVIEKGFNPLAYRYLILGTHYRSQLQFSWEVLKAAQNGLDNLYQKIREIKTSDKRQETRNKKVKSYHKKFLNFINDDLNIPKALALMWDIVKNDTLSSVKKYDLLLEFDKIFALDLDKIKEIKIPQKIKNLVKEREKLRAQKEWKKSDKVRKDVEKMGWQIEDTEKGPKIKKKK